MGEKIKIIFNILLFFFTIFFTIIFLSSIQRAEAVKIGKFELLTDLFIEETYDDNVLLTKNNTESSRVTTISPTVSLARTKNKMYLTLSYNANLKYYDDYSNENQYQQTGAWDIGIRPRSKSNLGIQGQNIYSYTKRDEREPLLAGRDNVIKVNDFSFTPYINQQIGDKFEAALTFSHKEKKYKQRYENYEDSRSDEGSTDIQYKLSKNIALHGNYRYLATYFAKATPDYTEQETNGGFTYDIRSKIRLNARYGHAWKKDELNQKSNSPTIDSSIDIYFLKATNISINYTRSSSHTSSYDTANNSFISHDASLNIRHDLFNQKIIMNYGGVYNLSEYEATDRKDKSNTGAINIAYKIIKSVLVSLSGDYKKSEYRYESTDRKDKSQGGGVSLDWEIGKPLTLSLAGKYTKSTYYTETDNTEDHEEELYDGSAKLAYAIKENTFLEAGYQYLENKSDAGANENDDNENNEYTVNRYNLGLKITF